MKATDTRTNQATKGGSKIEEETICPTYILNATNLVHGTFTPISRSTF